MAELSDEEIDRLYSEAQSIKKKGRADSISDEELDRLYNRETKQSPGQYYYDLATSPTIKQEMSPDITLWDRFKIKNFGGSDYDAINYLKEAHPGVQFGVERGQIVAKRDGDKEFKVLDPTNVEFADIFIDPLWDIGAGLAQSAVSATTGLAAAPSGIGALPAASLASGASGAALELGRQGIGNALGVNEGVNTDQAFWSGVAGLATPWVTGTGASGTAQAAKMMGNEGDQYIAAILKSIGKGSVDPTSAEGIALAKEALSQSQRSGVQYAPGFFGSFGVGKDTINLAAGKAPKIFKGITPDVAEPTGLDVAKALYNKDDFEFVRVAVKDTKDKLLKSKQDLQNQIGSALDSSGLKLNLEEFSAPLKEKIAELEAFAADGGLTGSQEQQLALLKEDLQKYFFKKVKQVVPDANGELVEVTKYVPKGEVSGKEAMNIKQSLKELTSIFRTYEGQPVQNQNVMAAGNQIYTAYSTALDNLINAADPTKAPGGLLSKYADQMKIERELLPIFDSRLTAEKYFSSLNNKGRMAYKKAAYETDLKYGTHLVDTADMVNLKNTFGAPGWNPISGGGTTSTTRSLDAQAIGNAVGGVGGNLVGGAPGREIGRAAGKIAMGKAVSAGAIKKFLEASQGSQKFKDIFNKVAQGPADVTQEQLNKLSTGVGPQAVYMTPSLYPPTSYNLGLNSTWNLMRNEGK